MIFHSFSIVHVTADLDTQIFPRHFETTVLHHVCRTSRQKKLFYHVNVDFFTRINCSPPRNPIIENQEPRPNPNASELALSKTRTSLNHFSKNHKLKIEPNAKRPQQQSKAGRLETGGKPSTWFPPRELVELSADKTF